MEVLDLLFDFSTPWFWITIVLLVFAFLIWYFLLHEIRNNSDMFSRALLLVIYIIIMLLQIIVFVQAIKNQSSSFDCGFYFSVLIPTVLFYVSLVSIVIFSIRSLMKGALTMQSVAAFVPCIYALAFCELSNSMAYTSPTCIVLSMIHLLICRWQSKCVDYPTSNKTAKADSGKVKGD